MSERSIDLRPASEMAHVEGLLAANGLPTGDLADGPGQFYVAIRGDDRIGVGGIEPYGRDGLLRSVVIAEDARGQGYGRALCEALEARASGRGIERLYLLTTTAAGFFADRGYETIDRADTPASIRATTEFEDLCPDSAVTMMKRL